MIREKDAPVSTVSTNTEVSFARFKWEKQILARAKGDDHAIFRDQA